MKKLFLLLISYFLFSCTHHRYSQEIASVLQQAGDNRSELEQVLKYYSQDPADSLKLRATEFLIMNMPGKYSEYYDAPWNDVATVNLRWTSSSDKQMVLDTYKLGNPIVKEDVKYITADYLINNIEMAFKVWREQPWGKYITFNTFCEEILPYRVNNEPLENWREKVLASFADINRLFQKQSNITAVAACAEVNRLLPTFRIDKDFSQMNYSMLMATTRGTCDEISTLAVFVMRALGVPVTIDFTPKWYNYNHGHTWNTVSDSLGNHIPFLGTEIGPGLPLSTTKKFRRMFANQENSITCLPLGLENILIKDVSLEYSGYMDIEIPIRFSSVYPSEKGSLAAWGIEQWNLIGWGDVDQQKIRYSVNKNVLYMPTFYSNKTQTPVNYPFMLNENNEIKFFEPDTIHCQAISIGEIAPSDTLGFPRMVSGIFEGANHSDFSDAHVLHIIKEVPGNYFQSVKIKNHKKFRYVRYVSPKDKEAYCNVAEIRFYDNNKIQLQGISIGTKGVWPTNQTMTYEKAFDGNTSTYFDADSNDSWTGLDLGEAKQISEIHYLPRTGDVHGIYEDQIYELFFWNGQEWQSLGKQKASVYPLTYQVPTNALLNVKNITIDKRGGRIFIFQNGNQKWI
ncbi:hypothetical protein AGMMS50262_17200 [Bacteroidia bacterium]|nr:hypothetical protein AGMMS50262_17200 [Bacteroidia bacterium]